ncbi:hypothetical protein IKA15_00430 [bacterium]|nr:hypothetical protein [bacterium]
MQATENLAQNLIETYESLIELQEEKRQILINHKIEELGSLDEKILTLYGRTKDISDKREFLNPTDEQRLKIRELFEQIKEREKINKALVCYSLNAVNKIFNGMMKMINVRSDEYNKKGLNSSSEAYDVSSIVEEA